jgi:hypothetical protein
VLAWNFGAEFGNSPWEKVLDWPANP